MSFEGGGSNTGMISTIRSAYNGARISTLRSYYGLNYSLYATISANIPEARLAVNGQEIPTGKFAGYLFSYGGLPTNLTVKAPTGYVFKGWLSENEAASDQEAEDKYLESLPPGISLGDKSTGVKSSLDEKKDEDNAKPMRPEEISVLVINESGINGAGAEVARVLAGKGFIISSVETGRTSSREQTIIVTSKRNTDVFYGMPFQCLIMDGSSSNQAVVRIGLDYRRQQ